MAGTRLPVSPEPLHPVDERDTISHWNGSGVLDNRMMSGDRFETMVSAHHGEIYRYLQRVLGRADDADDLSQETFLRAYRAYRSLPKDANVRAWLFSIATNLTKNHFRSESRRRLAYGEVRASAPVAADPAPEAELISRETGALVEGIVQHLPFKQRLAFTQRKLHGLDYEVIGQSLGCSAESARAHVFQAVRKIRKGLDGHGLLSEGPER
jgi:RNA polymerase sigma-70 factor, ECF subfamily